MYSRLNINKDSGGSGPVCALYELNTRGRLQTLRILPIHTGIAGKRNRNFRKRYEDFSMHKAESTSRLKIRLVPKAYIEQISLYNGSQE
jgi:hypothetical protein